MKMISTDEIWHFLPYHNQGETKGEKTAYKKYILLQNTMDYPLHLIVLNLKKKKR